MVEQKFYLVLELEQREPELNRSQVQDVAEEIQESCFFNGHVSVRQVAVHIDAAPPVVIIDKNGAMSSALELIEAADGKPMMREPGSYEWTAMRAYKQQLRELQPEMPPPQVHLAAAMFLSHLMRFNDRSTK